MLGLLALVPAALFTGAAVYVNFAEQPARLQLDDRALLDEWKAAYDRGAVMQISLVIVSASLGLVAWFVDRNPLLLVAAVTIFANWPYTLRVIMPVNRQLEATPHEAASEKTRGLIERWGDLHAGRSALGAIATVLFLAAAARSL